jgi:streptogramin lyase
MRTKIMISFASLLFVAAAYMNSGLVGAEGAAALTGVVSSAEEGKMEGVVVSARREGATFTVSVVSDKTGKYTFPRTHVEPGKYAITIRATGFDLAGGGSADIGSGKTTTNNLTLEKTKTLAAQMTSADWMNSVNGTQEEKDRFVYEIVSCNYCHTMNREFMSKHTPDTLLKAMDRMVHYYGDGTAKSNDNRRGRAALVQEPGREKILEQNPDWGFFPGLPRTEVAAFVTKNNLSGGRTTYPYELKYAKRPTGKATHVIITEWDMPTPGTVAHDSDIDSKGVLWYGDESAQLLGKFDTKTSTFTEIRPPVLPAIPKGNMEGTRDIVVDHADKVWFPVRMPGNRAVMSRYDPVANKLDLVDGAGGQFVAVGGDGYVWAGSDRIDPTTMKIVGNYSYQNAKVLPPGPNGGYHNLADSKGNLWVATYRGPGGLIEVEVNTKEVKFFSVPGLKARRGRIDPRDDKFYFGEYLADKADVFDIKTGKIQRFDLPRYSTPYAASIADSKGRFYVPGNGTESLYRIDPKTNEIVGYLMPTEFDSKKLSIDPTTTKPIVWMTNKRTARVTKVEPLD